MEKLIKIMERIGSGDYSGAHDDLDALFSNGELDTVDYVKLKLQLFYIKRKLHDADIFLHRHENSLDRKQVVELRMRLLLNWYKYEDAERYYEQDKIPELLYLKAVSLFKQRRYEESKTLLYQCLENNEQHGSPLYYQILPYYFDSCLFTKKKNSKEISECISIINSILDSNNPLNENILQINTQFYLIKAFAEDNKTEREKLLSKFFNESKCYKTFDDIIRYSYSLGFKPDDLFNSFSENWQKYDEDGYFASIIDNEEDTKIRTLYIKIAYWILLITSQIMIKDDTEVQEFCNYTSKETLLKMIEGKYQVAMLSLSNVNDKVEGEVLFEILKNNGLSSKVNCVYRSSYAALQTSYTRNKDSLTMFRLYGKEDGMEGTGVCLTFDKSFFQMDSRDLGFEGEEEKKGVKNKDVRRPVFWILYYDSGKNRLFYFPGKDELVPYIIDLSKNKPKWNFYYKGDTKKIAENMLLYSFKSLFAAINEISAKHQLQKTTAIQLLERLRYFIKFDSFSEEKECRMLRLVSPNDADVIPNSFVLKKDYLKLNDTNGLTEIILGPKITNVKLIREFFMNKIGESEMSPSIHISKAPLA